MTSCNGCDSYFPISEEYHHHPASSSSQGAALTVAETRKKATHLSNCRSAGVSFLPLAVETLGCWSQDAVSTIRSIGRIQALCLGLDPGETISHLFQRLSVALWRGNAQMWCSRFPIPPPSVDGVIMTISPPPSPSISFSLSLFNSLSDSYPSGFSLPYYFPFLCSCFP